MCRTRQLEKPIEAMKKGTKMKFTSNKTLYTQENTNC